MNKIKLTITYLLLLFSLCSSVLLAQTRDEIDIPDILGYQTLKCDFHIHTVFSSGDVWPTVRVQEAWEEGLDVIAITDHIEYLPHSQDLLVDHNRAFEIAKPLADQMGVLLIKGSEITRKMPPGHLNALFVSNSNLLEREDWWEACLEAKEQGAFVFWNHPGEKEQQPDTCLWWDEHTRLIDEGILNGIEVFNETEFYPEALAWANDKKLTLFCNSGIHAPTSAVYGGEKHRPVTLVFATSKSEESIKHALKSRRTVAYFNDMLVGERKYLGALFFNAIEIKTVQVNLENHQIKKLQVHNSSDVSFRLKKRQPSIGFSCPDSVMLEAHKTVFIDLLGTSDEVKEMELLKLFYEVVNMTMLSGDPLPVNLDIINR